MSHEGRFRARLRPALSGALFFQVKAATVCPAGLQKGDPPGKVAVYRGILPPEQGLQPPADLSPAALTCENEGAAYRKQTGGMEKMPGSKIRTCFHFFNTGFCR